MTMVGKTVQIAVRLEAELVDQVDELVQELSKVTIAGLEPTRSAVVRTAIARGLADMRRELGEKSRKPKR
jgi:metal-responsive CopG/Arc/MetJ family transcriptional regulator